MAYDIRMVKLVTGELALGKYTEEGISDAAILQVAPAKDGGVQMMMLPYGYPFEDKFEGSIEARNFLYVYKSLPEGLEAKYLEACTNLTLAGMNGMELRGTAPASGTIIR